MCDVHTVDVWMTDAAFYDQLNVFPLQTKITQNIALNIWLTGAKVAFCDEQNLPSEQQHATTDTNCKSVHFGSIE